jgi:non-canonical purine NTP pyrophosphatase (RdgB/HAM1 family)
MGKQPLDQLGFVTTNFGKYEEAKRILGFPIVHLSFFYLEPQEVQGDEIAAAKARAAYDQFKIPLFVDHTSLYIEAWNGLPGGLVGTVLRQVGDAGIIKMMSAYTTRNALGQTAIAFYDGRILERFVGEIQGEIPLTVAGVEYAGWDRIFIPEGHSSTYGEMTIEEKNQISQRRKALELLQSFISQRYDLPIGSSGQVAE